MSAPVRKKTAGYDAQCGALAAQRRGILFNLWRLGKGGPEQASWRTGCPGRLIDPDTAVVSRVFAVCQAILQLFKAPYVIKPCSGGISVSMSPVRKQTSGSGSPPRTSQLVNGGRTQTQVIQMLLQAVDPQPRMGALQVGWGGGGWGALRTPIQGTAEEARGHRPLPHPRSQDTRVLVSGLLPTQHKTLEVTQPPLLQHGITGRRPLQS